MTTKAADGRQAGDGRDLDRLYQRHRRNRRRFGGRAGRGGEKFTKINFVADRGFQDGAGDDEEIVGATLAYSVTCDGEWSATQVSRIIERLPT